MRFERQSVRASELQSVDHPSHAPRSPLHAFTLVEYVITIGLTVLVFGALAIFSEGTGRALVSITNQSSDNQSVGNGIELMLSRIRLANWASNDSTGNTLTLSFDDNPDVDSDGDGKTYNDQDHFESFIYKTTDGSWTTLNDNYIGYRTNAYGGSTNIIIPSYVRKLSGQNIFTVTSSNTVLINFGLLTTNATPFSQAIEIRTKIVLRNKIN
jgi:hypothetical protein